MSKVRVALTGSACLWKLMAFLIHPRPRFRVAMSLTVSLSTQTTVVCWLFGFHVAFPQVFRTFTHRHIVLCRAMAICPSGSHGALCVIGLHIVQILATQSRKHFLDHIALAAPPCNRHVTVVAGGFNHTATGGGPSEHSGQDDLTQSSWDGVTFPDGVFLVSRISTTQP